MTLSVDVRTVAEIGFVVAPYDGDDPIVTSTLTTGAVTVDGVDPHVIHFEVDDATTFSLKAGSYRWAVWVVKSDGSRVVGARGSLCVADVVNAP